MKITTSKLISIEHPQGQTMNDNHQTNEYWRFECFKLCHIKKALKLRNARCNIIKLISVALFHSRRWSAYNFSEVAGRNSKSCHCNALVLPICKSC